MTDQQSTGWRAKYGSADPLTVAGDDDARWINPGEGYGHIDLREKGTDFGVPTVPRNLAALLLMALSGVVGLVVGLAIGAGWPR